MAIKVGYENQTDIFGPSEINKGGNPSLMPCANPHCTPGVAQFPVCCQTDYPPIPPPPPPPPPSTQCKWENGTSLGLTNSTTDRLVTSAVAETKEACCAICRALGSECQSAHFLGTLCNVWSGFHPRAGHGTACIPTKGA